MKTLFATLILSLLPLLSTAGTTEQMNCDVQKIEDNGDFENINDFSFADYSHLTVKRNPDNSISLSVGAMTYNDGSDSALVLRRKLLDQTHQYLVFQDPAYNRTRPDIVVGFKKSYANSTVALVHYRESDKLYFLGTFICR